MTVTGERRPRAADDAAVTVPLGPMAAGNSVRVVKI